MKPIRPDEVVSKKKEVMPSQVIDAVNECIAENWDGRQSVIREDVLVTKIRFKFLNEISRQEIYDKKYLDFEPIYEDADWNIEYDRPGYNETYQATFIFTERKKEKGKS